MQKLIDSENTPIYSISQNHLCGSSVGKKSACSAGDRVLSLGLEDPLEKEMATHSSILAWKIPWTEEPGRLHSMGSTRVGHDLATKPPPKVNTVVYIF